jgi:hypothetical protein
MNKNKIFIITGALLFGLFIALLVWLQNIEVQPNDLQNSYQIEIFNCSPIAKNKTDVKNELNAALRSTKSNKDGVKICHVPILNINDVSFGIPIYGMNYFRLGMGTDMYLYEDREADETEFFKAADKNEKYLELQKIASKGWYKDESKVILDWTNNRNEFIISPSQKEKHSKNKKEWKSFLGLRRHIDSLIKIDKSEKNIKVYYFCGSIIDPMLDDDGDGIINSKDSCPQEKGSIERNGCPPCSDGDKDGICDTVDKCPNVRGVIACDGCVCPPCADGDRDGICDDKDKCPDDRGVIACDGCPDKDKDGIPDYKDDCPDIPGILNYKGCPAPDKKPIVSINLKDPHFLITGDELKDGYNLKIIFKLRNGKTKDFSINNNKFPSNHNEGNTIFNSLGENTSGLKISFELWKDNNKIEVVKSFSNISLICKLNGECGFKQF